MCYIATGLSNASGISNVCEVNDEHLYK